MHSGNAHLKITGAGSPNLNRRDKYRPLKL